MASYLREIVIYLSAITAVTAFTCYKDNECPWATKCNAVSTNTGGQCVSNKGNGQLHLPWRYCKFDYHCPANYHCTDNTCYRGVTRQHTEGIACYDDLDCPDSQECYSKNRTCYVMQSSGPAHKRLKACSEDFNCPSKYRCKYGMCMMSTSDPHLEGLPCDYSYECPPQYKCTKRTCFRDLANPIHIVGKSCKKNLECEHGYSCRVSEKTCYAK